MKKILLTAIIALIGMSAFAEKPASGAKGYFYNPAAGMFLDSKGQLSATEGQEFEVYYKSSDAGDPADRPDDYGQCGYHGLEKAGRRDLDLHQGGRQAGRG